ncbi:DUF2521 family protein [Shouchella lonarensis]|uniref:DUF2521 family protein n=1 Tax=Shouchella lonarensis TaxID=1464122 RepID=A0A1G6P6M0_9BACI|nr:DUF2521 family protein [Shouchella lonarensis]SDC75729.1 Protein of unknown function [Shouchella lonarensis]
MTVITTLPAKRKEKQQLFERKMLRQLSLDELERDIHQCFRPLLSLQCTSRKMNAGAVSKNQSVQAYPFLLDQCLDTVIDAYLLGATHGRFGFYGETVCEAKERCDIEREVFVHGLCAALMGWADEPKERYELFLGATEPLIDRWWNKGFQEGKKAYRLRLY